MAVQAGSLLWIGTSQPGPGQHGQPCPWQSSRPPGWRPCVQFHLSWQGRLSPQLSPGPGCHVPNTEQVSSLPRASWTLPLSRGIARSCYGNGTTGEMTMIWGKRSGESGTVLDTCLLMYQSPGRARILVTGPAAKGVEGIWQSGGSPPASWLFVPLVEPNRTNGHRTT